MKPLYLELQAFGPFVERQCVDFEKLSQGGFFLITGKTGSGKTSIFDAMTFALYGGASGTDSKASMSRNDIVEWRCTQAEDSLPTYVSFTFSVKGRKYNFTRGLAKSRKNFNPSYSAGELDEDGNLMPFFENPKSERLTKKAEELIGLTKEQFRQVVLLPQGQFERFLVASSDEKEKILQTIFDADRWSRYAKCFYEEADSRYKALAAEKQLVDSFLAGEGLTSLQELAELIEYQKQEAVAVAEAHRQFDGEKRQLALTADIKLAERFKALHELESKKASLTALAEDMGIKRSRYEAAESAEGLRSFIDSFEKSQELLSRRDSALAALQRELPLREAALESAAKAKLDCDAVSPVAELQQRVGEYESKRPVLQSFSALETAFARAKTASEAADRAKSTAESAFESITAKSAGLLIERESAELAASDYRRRYYSGIYGELAAELLEGEKCPVCGSRQHPEPAERAPDSISKDALELKEKQFESARRVWEKAEQQRLGAEIKLRRAVEEAGILSSKKSIALAELEAARRSLPEGIDSEAALDAAIEKCSSSITAYEQKVKKLQSAVDSSRMSLEALRTQIETAKGEKAAAEAEQLRCKSALSAALAEGGYSDYAEVKRLLCSAAERSRMHQQLVEYDTSCRSTDSALTAMLAELEGKSEPDSALFNARQAEIQAEGEEFAQLTATLTASVKRLSAKLKDLSKTDEHYRSNILRAENDLAFARKLRGDTGIGLQRYVLAVMFNQVIGEANEMLRSVHGGRYQLFRTDEKGTGNKRGLELKVFDSRSPENEKGRAVGMLSGGEKFLVSLALSIGMSTVAQKSGVQIDALFIDEGFGTLDEDSIADALKILEGVRRGSGTIGIISHVSLLEGAINQKLEVIKAESGSKIRMA